MHGWKRIIANRTAYGCGWRRRVRDCARFHTAKPWSQKRPESGQAWLQRFLPRSAKSIWSKINREKALGLIAQGRMKTAGQEAIERAKKNGRWESAYDSPKDSKVPNDLQAALDANPRAREFFLSLDKANRYAVLFRIQTVKKAATRETRIRQFVEMLERNERIHEPRTSRKPTK